MSELKPHEEDIMQRTARLEKQVSLIYEMLSGGDSAPKELQLKEQRHYSEQYYLQLIAENRLRYYHVNKAELRNRIHYLQSITKGNPGDYSSDRIDCQTEVFEQARITECIENDKRVRSLRNAIDSVEYYVQSLTDEEYMFIELRYFKGQPWKVVADELGVEVITAKSRWRQRLLRRFNEMVFGIL